MNKGLTSLRAKRSNLTVTLNRSLRGILRSFSEAERRPVRRSLGEGGSNLIIHGQDIVILPEAARKRQRRRARSQNPLLPDDNMLRSRRKDGLTEYEKNIEHDHSRKGALRRTRTQQPETEI